MVEGTNPQQLTEDLDLNSGEMESLGGLEESEESPSGGGGLNGLFSSEPHKPIDNYSGVSFSFEDGSKYLERGIDKLSGWPAILDISIGAVMMVGSKLSGNGKSPEESEESEDSGRGGEMNNPEKIEEELRKSGSA